MAQETITFNDKIDKSPPTEPDKQVSASNLNEIKSVVNNNATDTEERFDSMTNKIGDYLSLEDSDNDKLLESSFGYTLRSNSAYLLFMPLNPSNGNRLRIYLDEVIGDITLDGNGKNIGGVGSIVFDNSYTQRLYEIIFSDSNNEWALKYLNNEDSGGEGSVTSVNNVGPDGNGNVSLNPDDFNDSETNNKFTTQADKDKLDGIEAGAQVNVGEEFTSVEKTKLSNQSGTNTGDENTLSIQAKRPLKTINNQSLEGNGNIDIESGSPIRAISQTPVAIPDAGITDVVIANDVITYLAADGATTHAFTVSGGSDTEEKTCKRKIDNTANTSQLALTFDDSNLAWTWPSGDPISGVPAGGILVLEIKVESSAMVIAETDIKA